MSDTPHSTTRSSGVVLLSLSGLATALTAIIAATGGFTLEFAGVRLSMHTVTRPIVVALVFGVLGARSLGSDRTRHQFGRLQLSLARNGWLMAAIFAAAIGAGTYAGGAHIGGGADSSGYLSEARLWRAAGFVDLQRLRLPTPLAAELSLKNGQYPFTPVGYQPSGTPGMAVPIYPPGLPLHFAVAGLFGDAAEFAVVPLSAAGIVIVCFMLGRKLGGDDAALIAAACGGASPMMLYQATQPMSDVVAAFWWSLAVLLLISESMRQSLLAGVAAAIACAVRPNLFAMVPVMALLAWWWRNDRAALIRAVIFCVPIAVAAVAFAYVQRSLYGSASTTGYGTLLSLFSIDHVWLNLMRYPKWAIHTQSALLLAAIAAPFAIRRGWIPTAIDRRTAERMAWSGLIFFGCLQAFYLLYLVFDDWVYFRFLLPALPWLLVLQAMVFAAACRRVPASLPAVGLLLVAILAASWGVGRARALGAFRLRASEQRYLDVAAYARTLPSSAVFLTLQHSGSLSYNNGASVLRWDWLDPGEVDGTLTQLSRNGRPVFLVLENWEERQFRERFAGTQLIGHLTTPVFSAGIPTELVARVFAISDTTTGAAARPVSWPPPTALRTPRMPGAPVPERGSASSNP